MIGPADLPFDILFAEEGDFFVEVLSEKAEIIEPENVVGVSVCEDSGVRQIDAFADQLKSQLRWRVNQKCAFRSLASDPAACAMVSRIGRVTDLAMTANHRDTNAGSGPQEYQVPWIRRGH